MRRVIRRCLSTDAKEHIPLTHQWLDAPFVPSESYHTKRMYKRMLLLAKAVKPKEKAAKTMDDIKKGWREHLHEKDPAKISELLTKAQSSINYIKFITPKRDLKDVKDEEDDLKNTDGRGTFIYSEGKWVRGKATRVSDVKARNSNWMDGNIDPDDLARHRYLIDRQFFGGRGVPRPRAPLDPRGSSASNHDVYVPAYVDEEDLKNPSANNGDELDKFGAAAFEAASASTPAEEIPKL